MRSTIVSLLALAATSSAQNLTSVLSSNSDLSTLTSVLSAFPNLVAALGSASNITILAPSNEAFANVGNSTVGQAIKANDTAAIQAVLTYHVLNGTYNSSQITSTPSFVPTHLTNEAYTNVTDGQVVEALNTTDGVQFISGLLANSTVTQADVAFSGGIIHVIDSILTPPQKISVTAETLGLSSIAGALTMANLVEAVDDLDDVTVFVPSNAAFQAIGSVLANASVDALTSILEYHVINGTVLYSTDVSNTTVPTLQGNSITATVVNGSIFINQAKVIIPNVLVANGVVHVIDGVLNPNATAAPPDTNPTATVATPAFPGATSASAVPFTSGIPAPSVTPTLPTQATGPAGSGASGAGGATSTAMAARAMASGVVGMGALFAGAWIGL